MKLVTRKVTVTEVDNDNTGRLAKEYRKAAGFSLRAVARKIGVSAPYICDLENGHRSWKAVMLARYRMAVDELKIARIRAASNNPHSDNHQIAR